MESKYKRRCRRSQSTASTHGLPVQQAEDVVERQADFSQGFAPDTPVLMFDGHIKRIQDVCVGDELMGDDSRYRTVVRTWDGNGELVRVKPSFGESYIVSATQNLSLKCTEDAVSKIYYKGKIMNLSALDFLARTKQFRKVYKGYRSPADFEFREVPLDAWVLGAWLGDGTRRHPRITNRDPEIGEALQEYTEKNGLFLHRTIVYRMEEGHQTEISTVRYDITAREGRGRASGGNPFTNVLRKLGVWEDKHVPYDYIINSRIVRLYMLAGLLDTDGYYNGSKGQSLYIFTQVRDSISDSVLFLARSLGFNAYHHIETRKQTVGKRVGEMRSINVIHISGHGLSEIPCHVWKKQVDPEYQRYIGDRIVGVNIVPCDRGNYYGIELSGANHLFLQGTFMVSHDSTAAVDVL